jgi:hypothetical protein
MNENSSNTSTSSSHHGLTAEAISRRAYEIWEKEGRPENRDLHHWLRAEKELLDEQAKQQSATQSGSATSSSASSPATSAGTGNTDTQLQGSRGATVAGRDTKQPPSKRSSGNPFPAETAGGRFVPPRNTKGGGK